MVEIRRFPVRPDLEQYKKQAKELKHARGRGFTLSEAQHAIALDHGFSSWTRFRAAVVRIRANALAVGERVSVSEGPFAGSQGTVRQTFPVLKEARIAVSLRGRDVDVWLQEQHIARHGAP